MHAELIEVDSEGVAFFQSSHGTALFFADRTAAICAHRIFIKCEMSSDSINRANRFLLGTSIVMNKIFILYPGSKKY